MRRSTLNCSNCPAGSNAAPKVKLSSFAFCPHPGMRVFGTRFRCRCNSKPRSKKELLLSISQYLGYRMWKMSSIRKRRSALWPLVLLLLLATVAPKLSRMTCTSSGRSSVQIGDARDCCPTPESTDPHLSFNCCEFFSVQAEIPTFIFDKVVAPAPVQAIVVAWGTVTVAPRSGHTFSARPQYRPPRSMSARLADLQVFRV